MGSAPLDSTVDLIGSARSTGARTLRVLLVGTHAERAQLRLRLLVAPNEAGATGTGIRIAAEFPTLAAAWTSAVEADAILSATGRRDSRDRLEEPLTPREVEVLELLAEGLPNKAIAGRLRISDQTVKFHVSSICGKLAAANRTDAVRRAIRRGLITV